MSSRFHHRFISSIWQHAVPSFYRVAVQLCCPESLTGWSQGLCPAGAAWLCHDRRQLHRITSAGCQMGRRTDCRDSKTVTWVRTRSNVKEPNFLSASNVYQVFPSSVSQVGMFPVMMTSGSCSWRFALAVSLLLMNSLVGMISLHTAFWKAKYTLRCFTSLNYEQ